MASPVKRRVLAPLDANASVSASPISVASKPVAVESKFPLSPPSSAIAHKRTLPETCLDNEPADSTTPLKKTCLASGAEMSSTILLRDSKQSDKQSQQQQKQQIDQIPTTASPAVAMTASASRRSLSPTTSSVFDLSAMVDTSQATNITEPDIDAPRPAGSSGPPTREQSRQRAEILKLRLSLARYKVRTGQVDVPLEQLRVVPAAILLQRQQGQLSRECSASEWLRQQREQKHEAEPASSQARHQPPLRQRLALWGPASSSVVGAPSSRGRNDEVSATQTSSSDDDDEEDEGDDDVQDSQPLPQQPRHQLDTVDVIEDSDLSDPDGPKLIRANDDDEDEDEYGHEDDDDLPQMPRVRRLSPAKKSTLSSNKHNILTTPRGNRLLVDDVNGGHLDGLTSSAMRGSAVNGLLSLSRS
ncbi:uncharacterized protein SPSK_07566 [Sporothrix schenckii 1099-18]|uniref:Uncharacterized protein n=2 Tax=Sporothrix schenckii TaxID=29908 RepID=U7Q3A5_SPOS1|nr:uncharacterized protein SPSK_07566 [Sporothrix schenckii 1099-18]ERT01470.1 hypothetical protein HMPREF1624_02719 [Sporothrix schenckii ATCC 58251]KJR88665.1 hypothetical protein SPSK_07566 [Sporothrix schenckii 1099-18]